MSSLYDDRRMLYFATLSQEEQRAIIQRLSADGASDHDIASATRLSVEIIRQILGQGRQCEGCGE
jgi:DNA-directed RNA polymerase sigma subunit (sigma70/sigma32)